jgi:hypothetical protein
MDKCLSLLVANGEIFLQKASQARNKIGNSLAIIGVLGIIIDS